MNLIQTTTQSCFAVAFAVATLLSSCVTAGPEKDIDKTVYEVQAAYKRTFDIIGVNLKIDHNTSSRENVTSEKKDRDWKITIYDGFVKHPLINKNAVKLALCHEVGHLLGPKDDNALYADEKLSDVYAVVSCSEVLGMSKARLSNAIESLNAWYKIYPVAYGYPTVSERWEIMLFTLAHLK